MLLNSRMIALIGALAVAIAATEIYTELPRDLVEVDVIIAGGKSSFLLHHILITN